MDLGSVAGLVLGVGLLSSLRLAGVTITAGWTTYRRIQIGWTHVMDEDNSTKLTMPFAAHHAEVLAYCVRRIGYTEGESLIRVGAQETVGSRCIVSLSVSPASPGIE
jgi:hypothetical protein